MTTPCVGLDIGNKRFLTFRKIFCLWPNAVGPLKNSLRVAIAARTASDDFSSAAIANDLMTVSLIATVNWR
jgi:hypothetical protein